MNTSEAQNLTQNYLKYIRNGYLVLSNKYEYMAGSFDYFVKSNEFPSLGFKINGEWISCVVAKNFNIKDN